MIEKLKFVLVREENIVGKGENACYQPSLLFHGRSNSGMCGEELIISYTIATLKSLREKHFSPISFKFFVCIKNKFYHLSFFWVICQCSKFRTGMLCKALEKDTLGRQVATII